jgi:hypothetical protein
LSSDPVPFTSGEQLSELARARLFEILKTLSEQAWGGTHVTQGRPHGDDGVGSANSGYGSEERLPRERQVPGEFRGPHPGGPPGRFLYRGRSFNRVLVAPFVYPPGWAYQRWVIGAVLPPLFLVPAYYYSDWAALGLPPPQPGFQWCAMDPTCFWSTWPLAKL